MPISFWDHLDEFRSRLIKIVIALAVTTTLSFFISDKILAWLLIPAPASGKSLIALQPASVFMQSMRLALIVGILLALPIVLYQIWAFVKPGLSSKEAKIVVWALYVGSLLFFLGALFAYFYVIPTALDFFWQYSEHLGVTPTWTIEHYANFVLMFLLSFGLAFELPVILMLLVWLKIVSPTTLSSKRPHIIVVLAVIAAVLTPPDVVSQVMLLVPLWLLFEISLLVAKKIG